MWKKIYDCMVRIKICMYILKNKETILSVGVLKWFLLFIIIFLGERYEYWFISIFIALSLRHFYLMDSKC